MGFFCIFMLKMLVRLTVVTSDVDSIGQSASSGMAGQDLGHCLAIGLSFDGSTSR